MNKIFLLGRLTAKPELRTTPNGQTVCTFNVATNETYVSNGEKKQITDFHNVVAWGKAGEVIEQYLDKGDQILLSGRNTTRTWEKQDGGKGYKHEIILKDFEFVGGNKRKESSEPVAESSEYDDIKIEDIPF